MGGGKPMIAVAAPATLRVREATPAELQAWDEMVRRFANHRVVHTMAWVRSLEASGFGRGHFLVLEKNGDIVGCLPGLLSGVGPLRLFGSPPPASQSASMGPAFDEHRVSTAEVMEALVPFLDRALGIHHIEIMSPDLDPGTMLGLGFRAEAWPTYRVPLFPGNERRTLKGLKDSARRNVTRGIKQGLEVRFETDESFVDEHFEQIKEVYVKGGHVVNFGRSRVLECFRAMRDAGNLVAVSVYLPNRVNIATGMFTIEGRELLLWTWAHRLKYRWHRPTELMTWSVMQRALENGCDTFDLMGLGDFKSKFGAELDNRKYRWIRSRYRWLTGMRDLAAKGLQWQQALRGRVARWGSPTAQRLDPIPPLQEHGRMSGGLRLL
jgi:CelD/BcsL family acetyltransferase involved in cellulose biosynthesis